MHRKVAWAGSQVFKKWVFNSRNMFEEEGSVAEERKRGDIQEEQEVIF